jgi:hypothetical protein
MFENLSDDKLTVFIKFKKKILLLKKELDLLNQKLYFYKDVFMSMINNLSILNELKEIKTL